MSQMGRYLENQCQLSQEKYFCLIWAKISLAAPQISADVSLGSFKTLLLYS